MAEASPSSEDRVSVYLVAPSPKVINTSPPCLKLETFLRMTNIAYKPFYGWKPSPKGKMPWIEYKGNIVADSYFSIKFLSKEFGVDLDEHLTNEQKGIATAFIVTLEENTYWTLVYYIWLTPYSKNIRDRLFKGIPSPLKHLIFLKTQRTIRGDLHGHGIGRHTEDEIYGLAKRDFHAVSSFLGEKKFLFGDKPCLADAALFAIEAPFIWEMTESPQSLFIHKELRNLVDHATRIKESYFPDWDQIIADNL